MKTCDVCKRQYPRFVDFATHYTDAGQTIKICRICSERIEKGEDRRLDARSLDVIVAQSRPSRRDTRRFARHEAVLELRFRKLRDPRVHLGRVRDISQGGLRFTTDERLKGGQMLNVVISQPDAAGIRAVVRVMRVIPLGRPGAKASRFEIGGRFVGRDIELQLKNRRCHPRVKADFHILYRRRGDGPERVARVRDISRGGLRFYADEAFDPGEVVQVRVEAGELAQLSAHLISAMLIVDCHVRGGGGSRAHAERDQADSVQASAIPSYEIRARFVSP